MRTAIPAAFAIAMQGSTAPAASLPRRRADEWFIVSRWSGYLTIARTGTATVPAAAAPLGLAPRATMLGVLAWEAPTGTECVFLLARRPPHALPLAGSFMPAAGVAWITAGGGRLHLLALGRHLRLAGPARAVRSPPWRLDAEQRDWVGEAAEG